MQACMLAQTLRMERLSGHMARHSAFTTHSICVMMRMQGTPAHAVEVHANGQSVTRLQAHGTSECGAKVCAAPVDASSSSSTMVDATSPSATLTRRRSPPLTPRTLALPTSVSPACMMPSTASAYSVKTRLSARSIRVSIMSACRGTHESCSRISCAPPALTQGRSAVCVPRHPEASALPALGWLPPS